MSNQVGFDYGSDNAYGTKFNFYVRLVRGGQ